MPELPEVETTRRGLAPHLHGQRVLAVRLYRPDLRWPIPDAVCAGLQGQVVRDVRRRAKYLLLDVDGGSALWHLGMSGALRVLPGDTPLRAHDHVELRLGDGNVLRFNDPRRFGCLLWQPAGEVHPLLRHLGPEPLEADFNAEWLFRRSRGRATSVKSFLMDQANVVGVGNIYAAEALFLAGIDPRRPAGRISLARWQRLVAAVRQILTQAITRGGTTLRDFLAPDGSPGYFEQELAVYGREGEPCRKCGCALRSAALAGRASVWCPRCQH